MKKLGYDTAAVLTVLGAILTFLTISPALAAEVPEYPKEIKRVVVPIAEDGVQRVEITGGSYYYDPNVIVVKVNKPVELRVKKEGGFIPHNIIVRAPEAGIDFKVELKSEYQNIDFTPTKIGKYQMYCDHQFLWFANHKEKGMEGVIEVVE